MVQQKYISQVNQFGTQSTNDPRHMPELPPYEQQSIDLQYASIHSIPAAPPRHSVIVPNLRLGIVA
jgi:hypothetical protein